MAVIEARSLPEAYEYMQFAIIERGGVDGSIEPTLRYIDKQGEVVLVFAVTIPSLDTVLEFRFLVADKPDDAPGRLMYGFDQAPSKLIDAAQWMHVLNLHRLRIDAAVEKFPTEGLPGAEGADELLDSVWRARSAAEELLKFIPEGEDGFPDSAFWTRFGRETLPTLDIPGLSWRAKMLEYIDTYTELEAFLRRRYAELQPHED